MPNLSSLGWLISFRNITNRTGSIGRASGREFWKERAKVLIPERGQKRGQLLPVTVFPQHKG
jgi:hypothetical protein